MHKKEKFGDDLSDFRYSIRYVNQTLKPISGLEIGRIVPGFRFVYPLIDDQKEHIGSVEASFDIKTFTNKLKDIYGVRANFIIDKKELNKKLFKTSNIYYDNSIESNSYTYLKKEIDEKLEKNYDKIKDAYDSGLREKIKDRLLNKETFSINTKINDLQKIITFLPANNIENQHIGYFVIYRNSEKVTNIINYIVYQMVIAFIVILFGFTAYIRELKYKENLKIEVEEKTKELTKTAVKLEEQTTQLEELNGSLEDRIKVEVEKNAKQEREIFQQSKQAALGDMIGNIAHQWRQPLSAISTSASGMQVTFQVGVLSDEDFLSYTDAIINNAKYLSQTIDDFRDFIKSDKQITIFDLNKSIQKCLAIVNSSINNHNLEIKTIFTDNLEVANYENELQQAIINIFSNAKDALKQNIADTDDRVVLIKTYQDREYLYIDIQDSAGGIPEDHMDKIFEPYFTTKHQSQGTGLGLYMTHRIIVESMKGVLQVENCPITHNNKELYGAKFTIGLKK